MASSEVVRIPRANALAFIISILSHYNVHQDRAIIIANALILADLGGVDTHGSNRLGGYLDRIEAQVLNPNPTLSFIMKTPIMAHLDAQNTFGFIAGYLAIDKGIEIAGTFGVGIVAVKNSNHYGMAATYLLRAIQKGYGAFAFTKASRSMPPWGAKEPLLGTSPFAVGLPRGKEGDFVLDMSPSVAARGKIRKAAGRKGEIPEVYALDAEVRPTTNAEEALKGVVLPIGGPKGSGLVMMMDIFGGVLSGAAFAGGVNDQYKNLDEPQNVSH